MVNYQIRLNLILYTRYNCSKASAIIVLSSLIVNFPRSDLFPKIIDKESRL